MAHQYSRVDFNSSVEVNEVNLSLYYGGVDHGMISEKAVADVAEKVLEKAKLMECPVGCQLRPCCCVKKEMKQRRGTYF